jgi:hypothetical protein
MAVIEKSYPLVPAILWNAVADITEMRKGKSKRIDDESMMLDTEMYGIKTEYRFKLTRGPTETTVTIETEGDSENDERRVQLMFTTLDNMLAPFLEQEQGSDTT